jgi:hypothetical protein
VVERVVGAIVLGEGEERQQVGARRRQAQERPVERQERRAVERGRSVLHPVLPFAPRHPRSPAIPRTR